MKNIKIHSGGLEEKPASFASPLEVGRLLCCCLCCFVSCHFEALLLSPGFCPPREALLWSSGFRPPRKSGAASMMPRSPAGCSSGFRPPREDGANDVAAL